MVWWIITKDGGDKKRLTHLNDKNSSEYADQTVWCCFGAFNSSGTRFVGDRQLNLLTQEGEIMMLDFKK